MTPGPEAAPGTPTFSVIVPTRGNRPSLGILLGSLDRQTLARDRWEVWISFDGSAPDPALVEAIGRRGFGVVAEPRRAGPGAARNRAARRARGSYLAFTEDDCDPEPTWLERAAARLDRDPAVDVLLGETTLPDGSPARRPDGDHPHYLPTNLVVRRSAFESVGGYDERYFDAASGIYFREDSDLGFSLEERGARIERLPDARVVHPREHPGYLDPIRWARRYEMDALLRRRHPVRFRERIEIARLGPVRLRRPFVRACYAVVIASVAAGIAWALRENGLAAFLGGMAAASFVPVWAKWRFDPIRLPAVLAVPWVLVAAQIRGMLRARNRVSEAAP